MIELIAERRSLPLSLRKGSGEPEREHGAGATPGRARTEDEKKLLCAACLHVITSDEHRIEIGGMHAHTRANPAGVQFLFGCFREAPGARTEGEPTTEFTWFKGHAWRFAVCGTCGAHLGWRWQNGAAFWGLLLDRLSGGR